MYILDTDILIYFLKGVEKVVEKVSVTNTADLSTTVINKAELLYGACNSEKKKQNITKANGLLAELTILDFSQNAAEIFANEKARLKSNGQPISDMDLLIASVCIDNNRTLVTNNVKHFNRIGQLQIENWNAEKITSNCQEN